MSNPFRTTRRVEFGDTDMAGIMHFSNFFRFMEVAETDFLSSLGYSVSWTEGEEQYGFPRVAAMCDYVRPVRFGEILDIAVIVENVGTKSITYRFEFTLQSVPVATGRMTAVCVRKTPSGGMESLPVPAPLRSRFGQVEQ